MLNIKTYEDYNKIVEGLQSAKRLYNAISFKGNQYVLFLSNGKRITYSFNENNLPHLIGFLPEKLISLGILRKDTYYNLLDKFIEESYNIYKKINKGILKYSDIFSPYIEDKLEVFKEQIKVPFPNNIYFVCEYDRARTYTLKEQDGFKADYYIARKTENEDIAILGLVNYNSYFYPQTSRIIRKDEETYFSKLSDLLNNQVITNVNGLYINNNYTGF